MITAKKQTIHQESNGPETLAMRTYEPQITTHRVVPVKYFLCAIAMVYILK